MGGLEGRARDAGRAAGTHTHTHLWTYWTLFVVIVVTSLQILFTLYQLVSRIETMYNMNLKIL